MYKNNPHYEICEPPEIVYVNMSEKNIEHFEQVSALSFKMNVRGHLYLRPQVPPGELFVYTTDQSTPNKFTHREQQSDLIYVSRDTVLKIRSYKPGMVDSPILVYTIYIVEKGEGDTDGIGNMKR